MEISIKINEWNICTLMRGSWMMSLISANLFTYPFPFLKMEMCRNGEKRRDART